MVLKTFFDQLRKLLSVSVTWQDEVTMLTSRLFLDTL